MADQPRVEFTDADIKAVCENANPGEYGSFYLMHEEGLMKMKDRIILKFVENNLFPDMQFQKGFTLGIAILLLFFESCAKDKVIIPETKE